MGAEIDKRFALWVIAKTRKVDWKLVIVALVSWGVYHVVTTEYLLLFGLGSRNLAGLMIILWVGGYFYGESKPLADTKGQLSERQVVIMIGAFTFLFVVLWVIAWYTGNLPVFN